MKLGVTSRPAMVARLLQEGRNWDGRIRATKPCVGAEATVDAATNPPPDGIKHGPSNLSVKLYPLTGKVLT